MSYTEEQIEEMRDWLDDAFGHDPFFDADELTNKEVISAIKRYYDGGLRQFFLDVTPSE